MSVAASIVSVSTHVESLIRELCEELDARFGWAGLEASFASERGARRIVLSGRSVSPRAVSSLSGRVRDALPGWDVESTIRPWETLAFHSASVDVVNLLASMPGSEPVRLATQWHARNGPLEVLHRRGAYALVRAVDGTIGWVDAAQLGARAPAPELPIPEGDWDACRRELLDSKGAPYLLGGCTERGIDCSGLVQLAFADALSILLPRHTTDQLAFAPSADGTHFAEGDLAFSWTEREGPAHLGVVIGAGREVIHASLSRREVVVDSLERFFHGSTRSARIRHDDLVERARALAGSPRFVLGWTEPSEAVERVGVRG